LVCQVCLSPLHNLGGAEQGLETLSDLLMELTRVAIQVTPMALNTKSLLDLKEEDLKASDDYEQIQRSKKRAWVREQLGDLPADAERWMNLKRAVLEVREAVGERAQTIKRLDSDLRLHARLYEAGMAAGAQPRPGFGSQGSTAPELSIE